MKLWHPVRIACMPMAMSFAFSAANLVAATPDETDTVRLDEYEIQKVEEAYNRDQENDLDKIVCKKEAQTGTRIKKTVCRSMRTIEAQREHAKRSLNQMRTFTTDG